MNSYSQDANEEADEDYSEEWACSDCESSEESKDSREETPFLFRQNVADVTSPEISHAAAYHRMVMMQRIRGTSEYKEYQEHAVLNNKRRGLFAAALAAYETHSVCPELGFRVYGLKELKAVRCIQRWRRALVQRRT